MQFTGLDTHARESIDELKKQVGNLDGQIQALRKLMSRLSEKIETGNRGGNTSTANLMVSKKDDDEALKKLQEAFDVHVATCAKNHRDVLYGLDTKASKQDLADLEQRLRELIQEVVKGMPHGEDGQGALKKKIAHMEKMVSACD